ncbi:Mitochodrial transcription termination factor [Parasponia andersonii]|uniref:Mitochodrial transcription termination factor n=1 Tax=Parasponia andersonii TaxID=3476 RepID=A0A2P5ALU8_PARAD|nr:Mitochodrial transcription termination factor [Parasponia andersonii]
MENIRITTTDRERLFSVSSLYLLPPTIGFLSLFSSSATTTNSNSNSNSNSDFLDCLINTYKFTKTHALSISNRFPSIKSPDNSQSLHSFFRELGFSETQIRTLVFSSSQILFYSSNKTLKPKVEFFKQELGVETSDLESFGQMQMGFGYGPTKVAGQLCLSREFWDRWSSAF